MFASCWLFLYDLELLLYPVSLIFRRIFSLELQCKTNVKHCFCNQIFLLPTVLLFHQCRLNFENSIIAVSCTNLFPEFCEFPHFELDNTVGNQVYLFALFFLYSTLISSNN